MDGMITTVLGDIDPGQLGFCQSHEHLCIKRGRSAEINPVLCIDDTPKTLAELEAYYKAGGRAIVDAQPLGCGRDPEALAELSRQSGIHIIASTGFHRMLYYAEDHWIFGIDGDTLAGLYLTELSEGMYLDGDNSFPRRQSAIRAGQIKTALEAGPLDRQSQKLFYAAARAAGEARSPVMVHVEKDAGPIELADLLQKEGLPPEQLIFCHLDRALEDLGIHRELCRRGIYLEYDTIGRPKYHDDHREADMILEMVSAGFESRLLMSLDTTRSRLASYGGSPGLCHIIENFIPLLKSRGLTEEQIRLFFVENPARAFVRGI
jgi:phosphotriesterase-related protein